MKQVKVRRQIAEARKASTAYSIDYKEAESSENRTDICIANSRNIPTREQDRVTYDKTVGMGNVLVVVVVVVDNSLKIQPISKPHFNMKRGCIACQHQLCTGPGSEPHLDDRCGPARYFRPSSLALQMSWLSRVRPCSRRPPPIPALRRHYNRPRYERFDGGSSGGQKGPRPKFDIRSWPIQVGAGIGAFAGLYYVSQ